MTYKTRASTRSAVSTIIVTLLCLVTLMPIYIIVSLSLKTKPELTQGNVFGLPAIPQWINYATAWKSGDFGRNFINSTYITVIAAASILVFSTLGAYAFVYYRFPAHSLMFTLVLFGLLVPGELTLIPRFVNMRILGLTNTRESVIILAVSGTIPFGIFLLRGFMKSVPHALVEAARIDGAGELRTLLQIVVPIIKPALTALLVFTFMWNWNDYFTARIFLVSDRVKTLPLGLDAFRAKNTTNQVLTAAGAVITAVPIVFVYLIFQQKMMQGMVIGALKE